MDYVRFGIGFFAFMLAVAGVAVSSPVAALGGAGLLVVNVLSFQK